MITTFLLISKCAKINKEFTLINLLGLKKNKIEYKISNKNENEKK